MNIQEYIQSGIIESYVLGLADAEEREALELLRSKHPEIEQAIQEFEKEFERASILNATPVNPGLKSSLFKELNLEVAAPGATAAQKNPATRKFSFIKYIAAASVVLFILSAGLNIYTYSKYRQLQVENRQLALQRDQLFAGNSAIQTKLTDLDERLRQISGANTVKVTLSGIPGKEGNGATVYWNKNTKDVYLVAGTLPQAPKGKQYQLWALLDGKPIDAGILSDCQSICKLKNIQNAQAFAITLEQEGGSPTPNLEQLFVMGNI